MCGFAGFLSFRPNDYGADERRRILAGMGQVLARRGPDDEQFYDDGVLSLVFRRLSIVDAKGGRQPLLNEDKSIVLVANGEIYNHRELSQELIGHDFSSASDCEVALHAYEQWGIDAFARCRGMFAMAIWDIHSRRLTLARDRLGIKPLYVCRVDNGLIFASELKALLIHPACPRKVDLEALDVDLLGSRKTPTYVHGVDFLPAASYMTIGQDRSCTQGVYWNLETKLGTAPFGEESSRYVDALHGLIEESASEHLQGDGSVAMHLSGGLDSAMLAGVIARRTRDVPCFTIVERTTYLAGDVDSARRCAGLLGLPWSPILYDYRTILDEMSFGLSRLEESVSMMDSPRFDIEWTLKEELTGSIRNFQPDIKVIILGQGADEFAGGYSNRIDAPRSSWSKYLSEEINPMLHNHLPGHADKAGLLWSSAAGAASLGPYHSAMLLFQRQLQHHNLWHEDRTSAWHGVEARVPFLDHRIVELLASIPASLHETLLWNKQILRKCMRRIFPAFDAQRPKVGFCSTTDTRSIDIIVHGMATRVAPEFLEKYLAWPGFPFSREETLVLARRVIRREPGFYGDSYRLLSFMTAVIFKYQCETALVDDLASKTGSRASLQRVDHGDWDGIRSSMRAEPVVAMDWQPTDRPEITSDSEIVSAQFPNGDVRFSLIRNDEVFSEIELKKPAVWIKSFMRNLGRGLARNFTIQEWIDEFELDMPDFLWLLNFMYQSGFVVRANDASVDLLERLAQDLAEDQPDATN